MSKVCSKCNEELSIDNFSKCKSNKDGLQNRCKLCMKKYYRLNKEKYDERNRLYRENNPEKSAKHNREYYRMNKEKSLKVVKQWRKNNLDKVRGYSRKRRAQRAHVQENFTVDQEQFIKERFNNRCYKCGSQCDLQIDHHYPLSKGHKLDIDNAVVLCKSCNCSKNNNLPEQYYSDEELKVLEIALAMNDLLWTTNELGKVLEQFLNNEKIEKTVQESL